MYSAKIKTDFGELTILSTDKGVARLQLEQTSETLKPGDPFGAANQIAEYLAGKRQRFELPLDIQGTAFQQSVWRAASEISYGNTLTYKELALSIGNPKACRAVGSALGKNPVPIIVPCHRVMGSSGLTGFALGIDVKKRLLDIEK